MKRLIASDLHGSLPYWRQLLDLYRQEGAEQLVLLGDLTYFSGSYDPRYGYDPQGVIQLLNPLAQEILWVEATVAHGVKPWGCLSHDLPLRRAGLGGPAGLSHPRPPVRPRQSPPQGLPLSPSLSGHTHVPAWQWVEDLFCANPGSVSLPRRGSPQSCLVYEDGCFTWLTLEGEPYHWEALPPPPEL